MNIILLVIPGVKIFVGVSTDTILLSEPLLS
jgi:hypothetical protein